MKTVGAYEAKTNLAGLLDEVEAGNQVAITRRGRLVARLVPDGGPATFDWVAWLEEARRLRSSLAHGPVTLEQNLEAIRAGRRY